MREMSQNLAHHPQKRLKMQLMSQFWGHQPRLALCPGDMCAQGVEAAFDVFVAAVYLLDVVYGGGALGAHGGKEHGNTGADIGAHKACGLQGDAMIMADDNGAVRIAEDDLGAHVYEAVNEEQPALEHLLVDEDAAFALGGYDQHHGQKVRGEAGPGGIGKGHDGTVQEGLNLVAFLLRDKDIVPSLLQVYAKAAEGVRDDAEVVVRYVLDGDAAAADGGHADEGAHLDHVRQDLVLGAAQTLYAVDAEEVGAYAVDEGAHAVEHLAELLEVRFAGSIVYCGSTFGKDCGHDDVGGTGDGGLVKEHVAACEAAVGGEVEGAAAGVIVHLGAQFHHAVQVGVYPAAAYFVSTGLCEPGTAKAGQERSHNHHASAEGSTLGHEFLRLYVRCVKVVGLEGVGALNVTGNLHAHVPEELYKILDVKDFRDVADGDRLRGKEYCADYFQGLVLCALRGNASGQLVSALDDEFRHALLLGEGLFRI